MTVKRFDIQPLGRAIKTDAGFLKVGVRATRVGVFKYIKSDGSIIREFRSEEEVFRQDSLRSLAGAPVTNRHPRELVTSKNARDYSVGFTSDVVKKDGIFVDTNVTITHQDAIDEVEKKGLREVSCGYECDLLEEPGVYNGERYDVKQVNIQYNHLAIVEKGRAGRDVRLKMDSDTALMEIEEETKTKQEGRKMPKMMLNGTEFEVDGGLAQAIQAEKEAVRKDAEEKTKTDLEKVKQDAVDAIQAKLDTTTEELEKAKSTKMDASEIHKLVSVRSELIEKAKPMLKEDADVSEMSNEEIMKAAVEEQCEGLDVSEKSESYIEARFDALFEAKKVKKKEETKEDKMKAALKKKAKTDAENSGEGDEVTEASLREKSMKLDSEAWKKPIGSKED